MPIDGYLIVVPYYNKPTQEGMFRHFWAVADAVEKPVMLYNVPGRTVADLKPATVARLAQHPRIFGIKEATGELDRVEAIRGLCGPEFRLYSGDDATAREFMRLGGHGVVSVTANVAPAAMAQMCRAALAGDHAQAAEIDGLLADLHRDLFVESNPIPVKWALERMGLIPSGIRLPLTPLSAEAQPTGRGRVASRAGAVIVSATAARSRFCGWDARRRHRGSRLAGARSGRRQCVRIGGGIPGRPDGSADLGAGRVSTSPIQAARLNVPDEPKPAEPLSRTPRACNGRRTISTSRDGLCQLKRGQLVG